MMRRVAAIAGIVVLSSYGWVVAASAVYCALAHKSDLFAFPWLQWFEVLPAWRTNWLVSALVVVSALAPTTVIVLCAFAVWNYRLGRRALYGSARFAGRRDLRRGGLRLSRRP